MRFGAFVFGLSGSVFAEPPLDSEDTFLLQTKVHQHSDDENCFATKSKFGPEWKCDDPDLKQWCGSQDWLIGHAVRQCCPDLCPDTTKGGCGFDKTQCEASGCKKGDACCLSKGTTDIKWTKSGKDVDREQRQKCFKSQNNDWCAAASNTKYCGANGFSDPSDSHCRCNVGTSSDLTPAEVLELRKAATTTTTTTTRTKKPKNEGKQKLLEAGRKEWRVKNGESQRKKWQEKNAKKPPSATSSQPPTTAPTTASTAAPTVAPTTAPEEKPCFKAKCKVGRSCCITLPGTKVWDVGGKDITIANRDKCLKQGRKWCTQGNILYKGN